MSVRTLKIRRSVPVDGGDSLQSQPAGSPQESASDRTHLTNTVVSGLMLAGPPVPLEPPYDRQSIIRFPQDIADRIRRILNDNATTEMTEVIRIQPENRVVHGFHNRLYSIGVYEHQIHLKQFDMRGILVDLPTFVESYKTINNGVTITKSSDISQMLICFKVSDFNLDDPSVELQKAMNLLYPSGISPPTSRIRYRKFRSPPSSKDVQNLRSAEDLIENIMTGGALEWVIETEVDEEESIQRAINEPETVWTPTDEILNHLRQAGYVDDHGEIIGGYDDDEDSMSIRGKF
jgi:TATA-binding protein-associated factor Taf7